MKIVRRVKKTISKLKKWSENFTQQGTVRSWYFWYRERYALKTNRILLESARGGYPGDNIAVMLKELASNPAYSSFQLFLSGDSTTIERRKQYLKENRLDDRVTCLTIDTREYYKILATAT